MVEVPAELEEAALRIDETPAPVVTLRELLRWFSLPGPSVLGNHKVQKALDQLGLLTLPPLKEATPETPLTLRRNGVARLRQDPAPSAPTPTSLGAPPTTATNFWLPRQSDATLRLRHCASAFGKLFSVGPDDALDRVVSQLSLHHCDLLAVLKGPRHPVGVIGWRHLGEARLRSPPPTHVQACVQRASVVSHDMSLLDALPIAEREGAMLVHGDDRSIVALVTPADLLRALHQIASPFLFLYEIERRLRALLEARAPDALRAVSLNPSGPTLGDCLRVLEHPDHWARLNLPMDRSLVALQLDRVRRVRVAARRGCGPSGD